MSNTETERIERVRAFVIGHQAELRSFLAQVPPDGYIVPRSIAAAAGRCEIWPCTDAAIVLTYPSPEPEPGVDVREQTNQPVELFMRQSEVFSYFDETGEIGPMRLCLAIPEKDPSDPRLAANDFLFDRSSLDDLIAWPPEEASEDLGLNQRFFAPRFNRISILGWNAFLSSPKSQAFKDFRRAHIAQNFSPLTGIDKAGLLETIFQAGLERANELEKVLDQNDFESLRRFITTHPEVIRPDYLRAYPSIALEDRIIDLILLVPAEESPEYLFVTLGNPAEVLFTNTNDPSASHGSAEESLAAVEQIVKIEPQKIGLAGLHLSKSTFIYISARRGALSYGQKKSLYERSSDSRLRFDTYDDLLNRFRYHVSDVTEIRDRFLTIESRLEQMNVRTDDDFDRLMQEIDRDMQTEKIPLTARSMEAVLRVSSVNSLYLLNRDPLCKKVYDWFDRWYGERAKVKMGLGSMGVIVRGDVLRMEFPIGYGLNRIICSRELTKDRPSVIIGTRENPPTLNALDFVEGLTQEFANSLSNDELEALFNQFIFGRNAFMRIFEVFEQSELTKQAHADLIASSSHLFDSDPNYGLSKWASLQAAEKFIKDFIVTKGGTPPKSHNLKQLAMIAEQHGLKTIPEYWLDDIECSAEVRYGRINVTAQEAIEAQYAALQVCEYIAIQ
jgi:HEPN domain-containing protein